MIKFPQTPQEIEWLPGPMPPAGELPLNVVVAKWFNGNDKMGPALIEMLQLVDANDVLGWHDIDGVLEESPHTQEQQRACNWWAVLYQFDLDDEVVP